MAADVAIKSAIDMLILPSRVKAARAEPLPAGIEDVLRIVAGDEPFIADLVRATGREAETLHQAAAFYIEQVLLHPGADMYRNLGSSPQVSTQDMRRNMALLMAWLHPDKGVNSARQALAHRVMEAWHTLSNEARRGEYDANLAQNMQVPGLHSRQDPHHEAGLRTYHVPSPSKRRRMLENLRAFLLGQRPPLA
ncbi:MAG: hypothetical protein B7Y80_10125 [Hyphomicrobium sp. 32-62-53]|nr:MAG: hypothetical protein B7Z29_08605 [Hyphomicrobium sp. 12-62-95]OYX99923.1 MAG: hypothetical protein B7Y80_10125 [Hyphomicrobium sp. 32-62-53]